MRSIVFRSDILSRFIFNLFLWRWGKFKDFSRFNELVVLGGLMEVGELGTGDFGGFIRSITL